MKIQIINSLGFVRAAKKSITKDGAKKAEIWRENILSILSLGTTKILLTAKLPKKFQKDPSIADDLLGAADQSDVIRVFQLINRQYDHIMIQIRFYRNLEKSHFFIFEIGFDPLTGEAMRYTKQSLTPELRKVM